MGNQVRGKNVVVSMEVESVWYPIFCAKGATLNGPQEEVEVTHVNSGASRMYAPGMNSWTLNVNGLTTLDNSNGRISLNYLMQQAIRRTIWPLRVHQTDDDGNILIIFLTGFVVNTTLSRDVSSYSQSDVTFRITGTPEFSEILPPPVEQPCEVEDTLYLTLEEGEYIVQDDLLQSPDVTVLWVTREGLGHDQTTGTAGNRQFVYHPIVGTIEFSPLVPGNPGGESVSVGYKINPS